MSENSITPIYAEWLIWAQRSKLKIDSLQEDVSRQSIALSQIGLLQKEIAEIVVRNDHLQSENDNLRDRVLNLEQEINQQDQINAMKSQVQQISEDRIDTLWREFANVLSAVDFMQKDASIRREGQQKLLDDLHAQVRAATNRTSPTVQSPGDLGSKDLTQRILTRKSVAGLVSVLMLISLEPFEAALERLQLTKLCRLICKTIRPYSWQTRNCTMSHWD